MFAYFLTVCHYPSNRFDLDQKPTSEAIAGALLSSVLSLADLAGVEVNDDDRAALGTWLGASYHQR